MRVVVLEPGGGGGVVAVSDDAVRQTAEIHEPMARDWPRRRAPSWSTRWRHSATLCAGKPPNNRRKSF
jgi:hypothetical protein